MERFREYLWREYLWRDGGTHIFIGNLADFINVYFSIGILD